MRAVRVRVLNGGVVSELQIGRGTLRPTAYLRILEGICFECELMSYVVENVCVLTIVLILQ